MATIPITSQITTSTDEDNRTDSDTDLSAENTEDELHANTSTRSPANKKKLQLNFIKNISAYFEREPPSGPS